ncbi:hypothetical protein CDL12_02859 [Handroanthus impetiginosus]|uniref:Uncharacterized protein n=1 Tax=Handroanthus impetiginosus TaxID=429701 RepID=A0A2G9I3R1_9LAMI|nr:hypothetical protein CDL12_02859 [Handroanthus impetiginosus]
MFKTSRNFNCARDVGIRTVNLLATALKGEATTTMLPLSAGSSYTTLSTRWFPLHKIACTLQFVVPRLRRNDGISLRFTDQIGGNVFLHRIQQSGRESFIPCKRWTQVIFFLKYI